MEIFTNTLELQYPWMTAAQAAEVRKQASFLRETGKTAPIDFGLGAGKIILLSYSSTGGVVATSWSNWLGVSTSTPPEEGGWHVK